jgi:hypothetical protein
MCNLPIDAQLKVMIVLDVGLELASGFYTHESESDQIIIARGYYQ